MELPHDYQSQNSQMLYRQDKVFFFHSSKQRKIQVWTMEEDARLLEIGKDYHFKDWKEISKKMINRTTTQCSGRYKRIRPGIIKGAWTKEEDEMVIKLIGEHGKNWSVLSNMILTKNSKQIRDRYINKLDKNVKNGRFSREEDEKILMYYTMFGRKWTKIASFFTGRTGDMIKNRFYSCIRKKINHFQRSTQKSLDLEADEITKKQKNINLKNIKSHDLEITSVKDIEYICDDTKILTSNHNISLREEDDSELIQIKVESFSIYSREIPEFNLNNFSQNIERISFNYLSLQNPPLRSSYSISENVHRNLNDDSNFYILNPHSCNSIPNDHTNSDYLKIKRNKDETKPSFNNIRRNIVNSITSAQMEILELILKNFLNNYGK